MEEIRKVRVFVSSPDDVGPERERIGIAVGRLNSLFAELVKIETVRWETDFYSSHQHFQERIPEASACDLVIAIFWSRLGTPMPSSFRMENGERYPSGSAYEVLTAIEARRKDERPDVYVFRKRGAPANAEEEAKTQWDDLNAFFARWFQTPDGEYLRAYHRFETTDEFERLVERLLQKWIDDNIPRSQSLIWPIETKGSPFRSLQPFDAKHSAIFFGRDRKVTRAVEHLQSVALPRSSARSRPRNVPFLLIVGESGAGKSSLMRAGLAPRLTAPGVTPRIDMWRVAVTRIGDDPNPFLTLANALLVEDDKIGGFGPALPELVRPDQAREIAEILAQGGIVGPRKRAPAARPILRALRRVQEAEQLRRQTRLRLRVNLLLLVDQLENIFATNLNEEARRAFARLLFALAATRRVWIVATLRSDLYPRMITPGDFLALKDAGAVYDLAAPGESELTEIVHKSAAAAGLVYGVSPDGDERLDERILREAQGKNTLPLLEFALDSLFQEREVVENETQLTFSAYEKMGGLDGAIDKTAEAALSSLDNKDRSSLPRLLRALAVPIRDTEVRSASGELTVRTLPYAAVATDPATKRLVDALVDARIVVVAGEDEGRGESAAFISIAHQRVFESWKRARSIIADHRDFFRIRDEVDRQQRRWEKSGQKSDYLLARGVPLAEGQKILRNYSSELDRGTREFIVASSRRAQRLTVFLAGAAAGFAIIAIVAVYFYVDSRANLRIAQKNFEVATRTADNVVASFSRGLADVKSVGVKTIDKVLKSVDDAFKELWETKPDDPLLKRSQANMLYAFAQNYEKVKGQTGTDAAEKKARQSLKIRKAIADYDKFDHKASSLRNKSPEIWWDLARSFNLVGDVLRLKANFPEARKSLEESRDLLTSMREIFPVNPDWALVLSRVYTTLGDIDDAEENFSHARLNYTSLMENDSAFFLRNAEAPEWQREISWAFSKEADLILHQQKPIAGDRDRTAEFERARDDYDKALCLRSHLWDQEQDENTKISRDVAVTYEHRADAYGMLSDRPQQKSNLIASLRIRQQLVAVDRADSGYVEDLAKIYEKLAQVYWIDHPVSLDDVQSQRVAAAFYQAAFIERGRVADLLGGGAQSEIDKAKARAERALDAVRAEGMVSSLIEGWWETSIVHEENQVPKPPLMDFGACIAAVTQAARAVAPEPVAKVVR